MVHFTVVVRRIMSPLAARVFREPDTEMPAGRMYGLQLADLHDPAGNRVQVKEGDRLTAYVDEQNPERILAVAKVRAETPATRYAHA